MALDDTDGINADNIFATFEEYVGLQVRDGIVWGTNNQPTYDTTIIVDSGYFGGGTDGPDPTYYGGDLTPVDNRIVASGIYSVLLNQTRLYTSVRNLRAWLVKSSYTGDYTLYDQTNKAYMSDTYRQTLTTPQPTNLKRDKIINATTLESYFTTLQSVWSTKKNNTYTVQKVVCHVNCHASCHSSGGLLGTGLFC
jgi:hypothetical protein